MSKHTVPVEHQCSFILETGVKCRAPRMKDSLEGYCYFHSKNTGKTAQPDIIQAMESPSYFGDYFGADQSTWEPWKAVLAGAFGLPMEPDSDRKKLYQKLSGRVKRPQKQVAELWCSVGRRGGKSTLIAYISCYLATCRKYPKLKRGEKLYILIVSPVRQTGKIILGYCQAMLESSSKFKNSIKKIKVDEIELEGNVVIQIATANKVYGRGKTAVAVILEECSFFDRDESANPDKEILSALIPCTLTVPNSLVCGISSAYDRSGLLYEKWQEHYGNHSDDVLFIHSPSIDLNPTLDQKFIEAQIALDPERNRAEYESSWREDISAYIDSEVIERSVIPERKNIPPQPGVKYLAYTDGASGSASAGADSFTLCIAHQEEGRTLIDHLEETRPPFSPKAVIEQFGRILKTYGCHEVVGDRWSLGVLGDLWSLQGFYYHVSPKTTSEVYQESSVFLSAGIVELLDNQRSISQLRGLVRHTGRAGRDHVCHRTGSHDDIATVILGCVYMLNAGRQFDPEANLPSKIESIPANPKKQAKLDAIKELLNFPGTAVPARRKI